MRKDGKFVNVAPGSAAVFVFVVVRIQRCRLPFTAIMTSDEDVNSIRTENSPASDPYATNICTQEYKRSVHYMHSM